MPDFGRAKHEKYAIELPSAKPEYAVLPWACDAAIPIALTRVSAKENTTSPGATPRMNVVRVGLAVCLALW